MNFFHNIGEKQEIATKWISIYKNIRPNSAVGGVPLRNLISAA